MDNCKKVRYSSKANAKHKIKEMKQKSGYQKMSIYPCTSCDGYHLTRLSSNDKKRIRDIKDKFRIGQVWSSRSDNRNKFTVVSLPSNGLGLFRLSNEFCLDPNS